MANRFDLINLTNILQTSANGTVANVNFDSNTLFIDGVNNRVGVGTNAPTAPLHIRGTAGGGGEQVLLLAANSTFNGMSIQSSLANSTTYCAAFIDATNESGAVVANMLCDIATDGSSAWSWSTQPAGTRTDRRVERMRIDASGNFMFNSGYGSVATAYGCRAWVNFNGTGTVAIRGSGNVSSITDNNIGDYTVNFANAMPDTNYAYSHAYSNEVSVANTVGFFSTYSTSSLRVQHYNVTNSTNAVDKGFVFIAVFR